MIFSISTGDHGDLHCSGWSESGDIHRRNANCSHAYRRTASNNIGYFHDTAVQGLYFKLTVLYFQGFIEIGGYSGLEEKYMSAVPRLSKDVMESSNMSTCGFPREDSFHIFRHPTESDLPWPGMLSGIFLLGSWYWCTDQVTFGNI